MPHAVKHCVINCSDWRLTEELAGFIKERGQADRIEIPGAALALTQPNSRDVVLGWIRTLHDLHHFTEVHLIDHTDCGAYRLTYPELQGASTETERERHAAHVQQAQQIISNDPTLKGIRIKGYLYNVGAHQLTEILSS